MNLENNITSDATVKGIQGVMGPSDPIELFRVGPADPNWVNPLEGVQGVMGPSDPIELFRVGPRGPKGVKGAIFEKQEDGSYVMTTEGVEEDDAYTIPECDLRPPTPTDLGRH